MSLIEKAAKRLDQLRNSGVELPRDPGATAPQASRPDPLPTPEAVVRAIEARGETMPAQPVSVAAGQPEPLRPAAPRLVRPARQVHIDLDTLRARGFLTPDNASSQLADEFRVVKRPIIRNALGRDGTNVRNGNLVMITSAVAGEGKTFAAVNLAMSIAAELDSRVLLIDGDVGSPALPKLLGVPESPGLLDLLADDRLEVGEALVKTNVEKLTVMPAGRLHARSTELLASEQMVRLLQQLSSRYQDRVILFDSPPLLATTEARVLASHMGQLVVVVAADVTKQSVIESALATVEDCPIVMMLLNKASRSDVGTYYGYGYPVAETVR